MDPEAFQIEVLETAQSAHNYRNWLSRLTFPYLGDNPLELGSGFGDYAQDWKRLGSLRLTLSESSQTRVKALSQTFSDENRVKVLLLVDEKNFESFISQVCWKITKRVQTSEVDWFMCRMKAGIDE